MTHTSLTLLTRLRKSPDDDSWQRLAEIYTPLLRAWLHKYDIQSNDADDLVQRVLMTVADELPSFAHNQRTGAFRSWLRKILVNRLRDYWRSRNYRPSPIGGTDFRRQLDELADEQSRASELWGRAHDEYVMKRLLELVEPRFEPQTWQAFRRQAIDGVTANQVAEELSMKRGAVYMAKSRVLNALRQEADGLIEL